jgi:ubiquinone/menaquinone biosynthesis C-methylase UbiE
MKKPLFEYALSKLDISQKGIYTILDFGCGMGGFLGILSQRVSAESKLIGIDAMDRFIKEANTRYPGISFICKKFDGKLDLADASLDIIVAVDVLECISDKAALLNEFHRVLKPRGKILAAHWDWNTMVYNSDNKEIVRKAIASFSDWKQPWMDNCDGQMGRKLWGLFEGSKKFRGKPASFNLIETTYAKGKYGFDRMQDIATISDKGMLAKDEYQTLHNELMENEVKGQYFFSVTSFIYCGEKV